MNIPKQHNVSAITPYNQFIPEPNILQDLIENSPDAILSRGPDKKITSWNKGAEKMFGYTAEEAIGKTAVELGFIHFSKQEVTEIDEALHFYGIWAGEKAYYHKNGQRLCGTVTANAIKINQGKIDSVLFIIKDVTNRKNQEENNRYILEKIIQQKTDQATETENLLHLFIKHSPAAIAMFDRDMKYIAVSHKWIKDFKINGKHIIGQSHYKLFPNLKPEIIEAHQRSLTGEIVQNEEDLYVDPDGNEQWLHWESHPWHRITGEIGGIIIFIENITDRKITETFISKSEEKYKSLIERVSDGFVAVDAGWHITYINKTAEKILRQQEGFLLGKRFWDEFPELIGKSFYKAYHKALEEQKHVFLEDYSVLAKKWLQVNIYPSTSGLSIFFKDISKEKEAELKAKKNTDLLNLTLTSALDAMIYTNEEGDIINWNKQAEKMFGWTSGEVIGHSICDTIVPEKYRLQMRVLQENGKSNCPWPAINKLIEIAAVAKDGLVFPGELFVASLQNETETIYCAFIRDITERKNAETEITKSHSQLKQAQEIAHLGHWELDLVSHKSYWSEETYRIYGMEKGKDDIISLSDWLTYVHPDDQKRVLKEIEKSIKQSKGASFFHRILRRNGEVRHVFSTAKYKYNKKGAPVLVHGITHDITGIKKLELQLQEQQHKESMNLLSATMDAQERERKNIGEELHDNVNQILVATELYLSSIESRSPGTKALLSKCIQNVQDVIRENRRISHELVQPDFDDQSLVEKITSLSNSMLKEAGINFTIEKSGFRDELIDKKLKLAIYRIFQEQYTNIIRHSKARSATISFIVDKKGLKIRIADNGKGIESGKLSDGIGLRNIKSRLSLYDGKATIATATGQGFALTMMIPLIQR